MNYFNLNAFQIQLDVKMQTKLRITAITEEDDNRDIQSSSNITWSPTNPGGYYVKIATGNDYASAYCDASHDLIILIVMPSIEEILRSDGAWWLQDVMEIGKVDFVRDQYPEDVVMEVKRALKPFFLN